MVAMVYSQTDIIAKQVFLVERCDKSSKSSEDQMDHLKAVVFVRPTQESIQALTKILQKPKYKEYHLFFSNMLSRDHLKALAEADRFDLIRQVQVTSHGGGVNIT